MGNAQQKLSPEFRDKRRAWLRKHHRQPLRERALDVLGEDGPGLLQALNAEWVKSQHGQSEVWELYARKVLRQCAPIRGPHHERRRHRYITACIDQFKGETALAQWFEDNPEPVDVLDDDEYRALDLAELAAYQQARREKETEFAILAGDMVGLALLSKRLGQQAAMVLVLKIARIIDPESPKGPRRINAILIGAANPTTRHPEKYVTRAIQNEGKKRNGGRKTKRHRGIGK